MRLKMVKSRMFVFSLMVVTVSCGGHSRSSVKNSRLSPELLLTHLERMESRIIAAFEERITQLERRIDHQIQSAAEVVQRHTKRMFRTARKRSIAEQNDISRLSSNVRNALVSEEQQRVAQLHGVQAVKQECADVKHRLDTLSAQLVNLTSTREAHTHHILRRMDKMTMKSAVYAFRLRHNHSFWVYRDSSNSHGFGSGWIVIQRRFVGKVDFNRSWAQYRDGFGNVNGEHWLGLRHLYEILQTGRHDLLFVFEYRNGVFDYAHYDNFAIGGADEQYALKSLGTHSGIVVFQRGETGTKFATYDRGNGLACQEAANGGWWLQSCTDNHINNVDYCKRSGIPLRSNNSLHYWKSTKLMIRLHVR